MLAVFISGAQSAEFAALWTGSNLRHILSQNVRDIPEA
jgi:hypothetical protein